MTFIPGLKKKEMHNFKCFLSENTALSMGLYYFVDYFNLEMETNAKTWYLKSLLPSFKNRHI